MSNLEDGQQRTLAQIKEEEELSYQPPDSMDQLSKQAHEWYWDYNDFVDERSTFLWDITENIGGDESDQPQSQLKQSKSGVMFKSVFQRDQHPSWNNNYQNAILPITC